MSVSALDKVLKLSQPAPPAPDASELVRAAAEGLERLAVLLAKKADGDDGGPPWAKKGSKKKLKGKKKAGSSDDDEDDDGDEDDDEDVEACQALVLEAMVALAGLHGGEYLSATVARYAGGKPADLSPAQEVISLAAKPALMAMEHGPYTGVHSHAHRQVHVVESEHMHNSDSRHGGYGEY